MKRFQRDTVPLMEYLREPDARKQIKVLTLEFLEMWWPYMKLCLLSVPPRNWCLAGGNLIKDAPKSDQGSTSIWWTCMNLNIVAIFFGISTSNDQTSARKPLALVRLALVSMD